MSRHSHWAWIVKTYESVERVGPRGKECRLAAERWGWQKAGRGEEVAANDEIITRSQAPTQLHTQHTNTYTNTHTTHKHNRIQAPTQLHPVCALCSMCCFVLSIRCINTLITHMAIFQYYELCKTRIVKILHWSQCHFCVQCIHYTTVKCGAKREVTGLWLEFAFRTAAATSTVSEKRQLSVKRWIFFWFACVPCLLILIRLIRPAWSNLPMAMQLWQFG